MGVVRKQSILSLIGIYAGFAIGAVNQFLFIRHLSQEQFGLTTILREVFLTLTTFASLGTLLTFHRFFPMYDKSLGREKNDLPFLILTACTIGLVIVISSLFLFKEFIILKFSKNSPLFVEWFYLLVPLTCTVLLIQLFEAFAFMLKRTIGSNIIKEVGFRIFQSVIIILYCFQLITIDTFFILFSFMYLPSVIIMAWMVFAKDGIRITTRISRLTKKIYRKMISFTVFHFTGAAISVVPVAVNISLLSSLSPLGLNDAAVYGIAKFVVSVIDGPSRSMLGINVATISEASHNRDHDKVARIYQKTSISLSIVGIAIFALILVNINLINTPLFTDSGKDFSKLPLIFAIIGISKVFELSMGLNNVILYLSKHWRIEFLITSSVILLNIPISYMLTKEFLLLGTAIADGLLVSLFCILRFVAVKKLIGIQPYTRKTLGLLFIGILSLAATLLVPDTPNLFLTNSIKSIVFGTFYFVGIWYYKPSEDFNEIIRKAIAKVKKK